MRIRVAMIAAAGILVAGGALGCAGPGTVNTGTLSSGATVQPEQYLSDTRAAADAIARFAEIVNGLPNPLRKDALVAAAAKMVEPVTMAKATQARLDAMRLEDQRLETQRGRVRTANAAVVSAMVKMHAAAARGDVVAAKSTAAELQTSIAALRALSAPEA